MLTISSPAELGNIRRLLAETNTHAIRALKAALQARDPLSLLKYERLGCDPLDINDPQNIAEQIDQQATHTAAIDALEYLFKKHPRKTWEFAPGARSRGHDIRSIDGKVAAEVFAAVSPDNNKKLSKDVKKISKFQGEYRYVFFRSPRRQKSEKIEKGVTVISLGI